MNHPITTLKAVFVFSLSLFFCTGCGKNKPADFPKVHPCKMTIVNGPDILPNVFVTLIPETSMNNLSIGGETDKNGVAIIRTISGSYIEDGAPEGDYVVILNENLALDESLPVVTDEEFETWSPQKQAAWTKEIDKRIEEARVVPKSFQSYKKSQARVSVPVSEDDTTIDISRYP